MKVKLVFIKYKVLLFCNPKVMGVGEKRVAE
jgi:hypothetical protein